MFITIIYYFMGLYFYLFIVDFDVRKFIKKFLNCYLKSEVYFQMDGVGGGGGLPDLNQPTGHRNQQMPESQPTNALANGYADKGRVSLRATQIKIRGVFIGRNYKYLKKKKI